MRFLKLRDDVYVNMDKVLYITADGCCTDVHHLVFDNEHRLPLRGAELRDLLAKLEEWEALCR